MTSKIEDPSEPVFGNVFLGSAGGTVPPGRRSIVVFLVLVVLVGTPQLCW